jgi:hypothetical protein
MRNKNRNKQQQQQLELVVQLVFSKKLLEIGPSIFRLPFSLQFSLVFLFPLECAAKGREGKGKGKGWAAGVSYLAFHVSSSRFHSSPLFEATFYLRLGAPISLISVDYHLELRVLITF